MATGPIAVSASQFTKCEAFPSGIGISSADIRAYPCCFARSAIAWSDQGTSRHSSLNICSGGKIACVSSAAEQFGKGLAEKANAKANETSKLRFAVFKFRLLSPSCLPWTCIRTLACSANHSLRQRTFGCPLSQTDSLQPAFLLLKSVIQWRARQTMPDRSNPDLYTSVIVPFRGRIQLLSATPSDLT